jgi:hypothetical protein
MTHHTLHHSSVVASQFRALAEWIEQHGITPWHVEFDWGCNRLVVHLDSAIFLDLFPTAQTMIDSIGITWKASVDQLQFQSFSSHKNSTQSTKTLSETTQTTNMRDSA